MTLVAMLIGAGLSMAAYYVPWTETKVEERLAPFLVAGAFAWLGSKPEREGNAGKDV